MIEKLNKSDVDVVADLWLKVNLETHSFICRQYWESNFDLVKNLISQAEVYVFKSENEVKGFIGLSGNHIEGVFVHSQSQSNGIGKQLIDFVKSKKNELSLNVYQKNTRAIQFYSREGFIIHQEVSDKATSEKEYVMIWICKNQ